MELPKFNELQDLHEVHDMLADRIKQWPERWEEKGRQEGRQEGLQEGRQEAEKRALEGKRNAARNLIARTEMEDQLIAEITGLAVEEVSQLRSENKH